MEAKRAREENEIDLQFDLLEERLKEHDEMRETVIKSSRDVQKAAKQAIYSIQRNDLEKATALIKKCEQVSNEKIFDLIKAHPDLRNGSFTNALEEYVEAVLFLHFCHKTTSSRPMPMAEIILEVNSDEYLGGLMDCCGEVQRRVVLQATQGQVAEVERCRDYVDYVMGRVMLFDFRNGSLRKKSDSIKWVLKRIEEVLFECKVGARMRPEEGLAETSNEPEAM